MYLIAIAWIYVALMMAVAEATNTNGTVIGAIVTFVLYGVFPVSIVMYLLRTPVRKRARKAQERADWVAQQNAMAVATVEPAIDSASAQATTEATYDTSIINPTDAASTSTSISQPDASGHAPSAAQAGSVTPVRKEL
jgi:uncharacterized membrane protein